MATLHDCIGFSAAAKSLMTLTVAATRAMYKLSQHKGHCWMLSQLESRLLYNSDGRTRSLLNLAIFERMERRNKFSTRSMPSAVMR
jgi:hypothetical protein